MDTLQSTASLSALPYWYEHVPRVFIPNNDGFEKGLILMQESIRFREERKLMMLQQESLRLEIEQARQRQIQSVQPASTDREATIQTILRLYDEAHQEKKEPTLSVKCVEALMNSEAFKKESEKSQAELLQAACGE
jgi:hypothetical protein